MTMTTVTSREFNQGASEAKRAANNGPVFITNRGRPAHVLMRFEDYQRLTRQRRNIADALTMPGMADFEFEPPARDWSNTYCPSFPGARCLSTPPWHNVAPGCMCPTSVASAMHLSRQPPLCMA